MTEKILKGLALIDYKFKKKPLVLGGLALEYYKIRKTTHDYDYMVSPVDWKALKKLHPDKINLFGGKTETEAACIHDGSVIHRCLLQARKKSQLHN